MNKHPAYTHRTLELRAADYYAHTRKPPEDWQSIEDLDAPLAEFEHRMRAGDCATACRMLDSVDVDHLYLWGHYSLLLSMRKRLQGYVHEPSLLATNLNGLGRAHHALGEIDAAIDYYLQEEALLQHMRDRKALGRNAGLLGQSYYAAWRAREAIACFERALVAAKATDDRRWEAIHLSNLGHVYRHRGQFDVAVGYYEKGLHAARVAGERREEGVLLGSQGVIQRYLGHWDAAFELYHQAWSIARELGDRRRMGIWLGRRARTLYMRGDLEPATACLRDSMAIAREIGHSVGESICWMELGRVALSLGEPEVARHCLQSARERKVRITFYVSTALLGAVHLRLGLYSQAGAFFAEAAEQCAVPLKWMPDAYEPNYMHAFCLAGQACCAAGSESCADMAAALAQYQRALAITRAPGVVQKTILDLSLLRDAGVAGLEPVFDLLQGALAAPPGAV